MLTSHFLPVATGKRAEETANVVNIVWHYIYTTYIVAN
jgi:hypothetical protein